MGVDIGVGMASRVGVAVEIAAVLQAPVTMAKRARKATRVGSSISLNMHPALAITGQAHSTTASFRRESCYHSVQRGVVGCVANPVPNTSIVVENFTTTFELFPGGSTGGGVAGNGVTDALGMVRLILFSASNIRLTATPPSGIGIIEDRTLVVVLPCDLPSTIIIKKVTTPPGGTGFSFTENITEPPTGVVTTSFTLDDSQIKPIFPS